MDRGHAARREKLLARLAYLLHPLTLLSKKICTCNVCKAQELTESNKLARCERCQRLLKRYPASLVNFIWFTDEKLFNIALPANAQNDRLYAAFGTSKKDIPSCRLLRTRATYSKSLVVSVDISAFGRTSVHVVDPDTKINGQYYRDQLLM